MKIKNKTFVVTGAGSGIGRALVLELIARGGRVAAVDVDLDALNLLSKTIENKDVLSTHTCNVADIKNVENLVGEVVEVHGEVDGIINNAGIIQPFVTINNLEYDSIDKVMSINFYGVLYMTKTFLPILEKRPEAHICNVSSMGGFLPVPGQGVYGASKAAVKLLSEALYAELRETNIHVSVVFPGATATNITKNSGVETPKMSEAEMKEYPSLSSERAAQLIIRGIEKNKVRILTGKDSKFMDKLYRLTPTLATNYIAKQMKSLLQ